MTHHPHVRFVAILLLGLLLPSLCPPLAAALSGCVGDCDGDGRVTIDELVRGVNIGLAMSSVEICEAADRNGDGAVSIDELVTAVNNALAGCPPTPSPSVTTTVTWIPPTVTPLPFSAGRVRHPPASAGRAPDASRFVAAQGGGGGGLAGLALLLVLGAGASVHGRPLRGGNRKPG